jgi:hypothetical protein
MKKKSKKKRNEEVCTSGGGAIYSQPGWDGRCVLIGFRYNLHPCQCKKCNSSRKLAPGEPRVPKG